MQLALPQFLQGRHGSSDSDEGHDFDCFQCVQVGRVSGWHPRVEVEEEACKDRTGCCLHALSSWETVGTSRQCFARPRWRTSSFFEHCWSAILPRAVTVFFLQFCVVDSRELHCLLFTCVCKDTRRKCRRFKVDNFNESSSDYRFFFASNSCFHSVKLRFTLSLTFVFFLFRGVRFLFFFRLCLVFRTSVFPRLPSGRCLFDSRTC